MQDRPQQDTAGTGLDSEPPASARPPAAPNPARQCSNHDRLNAIARITRNTVGTVPPAQNAREMVEQARQAFGMDACVIRLLEGSDLVLFASSGLPQASCHPRIPIGWGIAEEIMQRRCPVFIQDVLAHPVLAPLAKKLPNSFEFRSYAGAPLLAGDSVIGVLGLYSIDKREDLAQEDLDCIQLMANSMSVAIVNDRLYEQIARDHERLEQEVASRRRAEKLLAESRERLQLAASAARMFAFEWDPRTDEVRRSDHCAPILGLSEDPRQDSGQSFFERIHPDDRSGFIALLDSLNPANPAYSTSYRVVRRDAQVIWLEESARGFFDAQGRLIRLVGMTADVTDRRRAEEESLRLRENLARVSRVTAMGELTATLAHEVNQPLGAIAANASACQRLLQQPRLDLEEIRAALTDIASDASRATGIINNVRNFLRKSESQRIPLDLNATIRTVVEMVGLRSAIARVRLDLSLQPDLPRVQADQIQLQQVVVNLLTNAIDAVSRRPPGARAVNIQTSSTSPASVSVTIQDNGMGIPAADLDRIFEPFFTTKPHGIGMGLPICRSILEAHGGRLWVQSVEGEGSTFHFSLPARIEDAG